MPQKFSSNQKAELRALFALAGEGSIPGSWLADASIPISKLDGVTAADVTNWNNSYSWGNHALAGYLLEATFLAHPAYVISSAMVANWNAAYLWGDHSVQGYATQAWVTGQTYATQAWVVAQGYLTTQRVMVRERFASVTNTVTLTGTPYNDEILMVFANSTLLDPDLGVPDWTYVPATKVITLAAALGGGATDVVQVFYNEEQ